jgi:hypothetical protein
MISIKVGVAERRWNEEKSWWEVPAQNMENWCHENCKDIWTNNWQNPDFKKDRFVYDLYLMFKSKEDAALFKLWFC